jgi:hypothetical protein
VATVIAIVSPLVAGILGACLTYWFGLRRSLRDHLLQTRAKAYADYLSVVTQKGRTPKPSEAYDRILGQIEDAKYRICVYASDPVVSALAHFESYPSGTEQREIEHRFLSLCQAMRKDSRSGDQTDLATLRRAAYGPMA